MSQTPQSASPDSGGGVVCARAPSPIDRIWAAQPAKPTGMIVLADGTVLPGIGVGATGHAVGELCFNTAMTGYQEILTDPSYAAQHIVFTFPHIGNVGTNDEDVESVRPLARGAILRADLTAPANYRAGEALAAWLTDKALIGICGVDTRALTRHLRDAGFANAVIAHDPDGAFDLDALKEEAARWPGLEGMDLAKDAGGAEGNEWHETLWQMERGYGRHEGAADGGLRITVLDYGVKRNILRSLAERGCTVTLLPPETDFQTLMASEPDGVLVSNGPGDPAATGRYAAETLRPLIESAVPTFGICLGHQMLALAAGARTEKMRQGHHGANHPVKELQSGKVEITSMNHGFTVDRDSLPDGVEETHISLFDGTNCGLAFTGKPVFSVQYHPEASPGPQDSQYLFDRFVDEARKAAAARNASSATGGPK